MTISKISCQACGASLPIREATRFITCDYCQASFEMLAGSGTGHSPVLDQPDQDAPISAEDMRLFHLQNELLQFDQSWEEFCEKTVGKGGVDRGVEPILWSSVLLGLFSIGLGIYFIVNSGGFEGDLMIGVIGLLVIGIGIGLIAFGRRRTRDFDRAESEYRGKREKLVQRIEEARSSCQA